MCICVHALLCVSVCCFISAIEVFSMNTVDYKRQFKQLVNTDGQLKKTVNNCMTFAGILSRHNVNFNS